MTQHPVILLYFIHHTGTAMDYSHQFFPPHEDPALDIYQQQHFQPPLLAFNEESYGPAPEHIHAPNVISTHPMHRPVIPSLEEAAEAEDTSIRPRLTQEQIAVLEENFKSKPKPGTDFKKHLATRIGLSLQRVNVCHSDPRTPKYANPPIELVPKPSCQGEASEAAGTEIRRASERRVGPLVQH